jgi:hypothetical protein
MHPTKKLDVRPISLYEISYKLVETILAERISAVTNPKLHPAQHAFNSLRSVVDAITTYTLVMEDANQFHKEIHISNNDCTQAYDAVPPWAMKAVYRYHGFPPEPTKVGKNAALEPSNERKFAKALKPLPDLFDDVSVDNKLSPALISLLEKHYLTHIGSMLLEQRLLTKMHVATDF